MQIFISGVVNSSVLITTLLLNHYIVRHYRLNHRYEKLYSVPLDKRDDHFSISHWISLSVSLISMFSNVLWRLVLSQL